MNTQQISERAMQFICNELAIDANGQPTETAAKKHLIVCAELLMASIITAKAHGFIKTNLGLIGFQYHLEKFLDNLDKPNV